MDDNFKVTLICSVISLLGVLFSTLFSTLYTTSKAKKRMNKEENEFKHCLENVTKVNEAMLNQKTNAFSKRYDAEQVTFSNIFSLCAKVYCYMERLIPDHTSDGQISYMENEETLMNELALSIQQLRIEVFTLKWFLKDDLLRKFDSVCKEADGYFTAYCRFHDCFNSTKEEHEERSKRRETAWKLSEKYKMAWCEAMEDTKEFIDNQTKI